MTDNLPTVIPNPADTDEPFVEPSRQDPIYQALSNLGVHKLFVTYSGSGDSGCIDEIEAYDKDAKLVPLPGTPVSVTLMHSDWDFETGKYSTTIKSIAEMPLKDAVDQWCYDLLEEHFPGWEINEGSSGTITINPEGREGEIEHTYLIPDYAHRSFQ
jgi:hypothetical protein